MSPLDDESGGLIFIVVLYSVKVALKVRQGGSESPCRWLRRDGVYSIFEKLDTEDENGNNNYDYGDQTASKAKRWTAQIEAQRASGLSVKEFCEANGLTTKTYYYHLRKVREECVASVPAIVPVSVPQNNSEIKVEKNGLIITLSADILPETLTSLVHELC